MDEFAALMDTSKSKLVVVDFTASWCGPCRFIAPVFEKLASENSDVEFVKVDVDDADDVAAHCQIQAMPTFHFYKSGAKVAEFSGADQAKLTSLVQQLK
jgi:thioredoxin